MNLLYVLCLAQATLAATIIYNWDITWVEANPDGKLRRPVIGTYNGSLFSEFLLYALMLSRH